MYKRVVFTLMIVLMVVSLSFAPVTASGTDPLSQMQQFWVKAYTSRGMVSAVNPLVTQVTPSSPYPPAGTVPAKGMNYRLLANAPADECFLGVGQYQGGACPAGSPGKNKVNQAYLWGLTQNGDNLWFGTIANVVCMVIDMYGGNTTLVTDNLACAYGPNPINPKLTGAAVDWRPPKIYAYNTQTGDLVDKTPNDPLMMATTGLRSAGSIDDIVFVGGPGFGNTVNLFAFKGSTGEYLGATALAGYNNIRKWLAYDGALYLAVGSQTGGAVLRWMGSTSSPFVFDVVGNLDSDGAEIVPYNGRIVVSTWPVNPHDNVGYSGLWMSPVVPAGGLTAANAAQWTKVFDIRSYEPDPVVAGTLAAGGIANYGGYLYWSTLALPGSGLTAFTKVYGAPANEAETLTDFLGTYRPTIVFRGKNIGAATQRVELLYGSIALPVYVPGKGWSYALNRMNAIPRYGAAGYGNFFNAYTWSMDVYQNQLYAGTFDWSLVAHEVLNAVVKGYTGTDMTLNISLPNETYGADLYRFSSTYMPAQALSLYGVGNYFNYGVRNMLPANGKLYIGSANPFNMSPKGGWELIELSK